jgi:hypothetical protein
MTALETEAAYKTQIVIEPREIDARDLEGYINRGEVGYDQLVYPRNEADMKDTLVYVKEFVKIVI